MTRSTLCIFIGVALLALGGALVAQEPAPDPSTLERAFPTNSFSPYANRAFPTNVYWGDTH